jgi:hypothetical protein
MHYQRRLCAIGRATGLLIIVLVSLFVLSIRQPSSSEMSSPEFDSGVRYLINMWFSVTEHCPIHGPGREIAEQLHLTSTGMRTSITEWVRQFGWQVDQLEITNPKTGAYRSRCTASTTPV